MSKAINAAMIDALATEVGAVDSLVLIGFEGLNSSETVQFRAKLRSKNFRMRVVKNTMATVAFDRADKRGLGARLAGSSAVIFGGEGAIAISKLLVEEVKTNKKLKIHGAYSEGEVLDAAGVKTLSQVPSRQELLAMTLAALFGPVSDMQRNLEGLLSETDGLIEALVKQKEPAEPAAAS